MFYNNFDLGSVVIIASLILKEVCIYFKYFNSVYSK